jgi:hypothetical protein
LRCCLHLFRMLGFDYSCINFLFLAWWSSYSFLCDGTCKDWYLSFPNCTMGYLCNVTWDCPITCLTFWKSSNVILSSSVVFFYGPTTQTWIYFTFNRCSFGCCVNMSLLLCRSSSRGLVIANPTCTNLRVTCFDNNNACSDNCYSRQGRILHKANVRRWFHSPCHRDLRLSPSLFWFLSDFLCTC